MEAVVRKLDKQDFITAVKACCSSAILKEGKQIHADIIQNSFEQDEIVGSVLIELYAKCGSLKEARNVFNKLKKKSYALPWNVMTTGYILYGDAHEVMWLYCQMLQENLRVNHVSFLNVLKACSSTVYLEGGMLVYANIIENGFESHHSVCNTLMDMYLKCGLLKDAHEVFKRLLLRDVVSWNAMISGLAQENSLEAFHLFGQMQYEGRKPDSFTYASILKACYSLEATDQVKLIHTLATVDGFESDRITGSSLMDAYAKCGHLEDAQRLWDRLPKPDVVAYNSIIAGYAQHGEGQQAMKLFVSMQDEGKHPDEATLVSVLKAACSVTSVNQGKLVHSLIIRSGCKLDVGVGTSLMNMYVKFGNIKQARGIFYDMALKNVATWNVLFSGLLQFGQPTEVFKLFQEMQKEDTEPDNLTFVSLLKVCTSEVSLEQGKWAHCYIIESGLEHDDRIGNTLVDMYAKCEHVECAHQVFDQLQNRTVVAWSAMIAGYALQGEYEEVAENFDAMQKNKLKPDDVAYVNLLSACSRKGLLKEGLVHFSTMMRDYGIKPKLEHYTCMVRLLGHAGRLTDAEFMLKSMPCQCNIVGWMLLFESCITHGKVEIARGCFDRIMLIDCKHAAAYTLMSNMYSGMGMQEEADHIEAMRKRAQIRSRKE
ncbi:hypothetical protein GOP47_0024171 [Adiantum capillus-veneris]|uniref:Pentatricopeptide repeat-containing protein n=1 Tax=Adiantum capillus-veneris TaxID=13818 RepID=A0A9D4U7C9_ADICA|nr:hypothetical protein GOP47_0024171 [Adiantum capillus-veneris]